MTSTQIEFARLVTVAAHECAGCAYDEQIRSAIKALNQRELARVTACMIADLHNKRRHVRHFAIEWLKLFDT